MADYARDAGASTDQGFRARQQARLARRAMVSEREGTAEAAWTALLLLGMVLALDGAFWLCGWACVALGVG